MKFRKYTNKTKKKQTKKQQKTKTKQNKSAIKCTTSYVIFLNLSQRVLASK